MRDMFICMNHRESVIFSSGKDNPACPVCKEADYVSGYSGTKPRTHISDAQATLPMGTTTVSEAGGNGR